MVLAKRSSGRRLTGLALVLVGLLAAGCERPPPPAVAARLSGDQVELLYVGCYHQSISRITVVDGRNVIHDPDDPVLWQVSFDPPTTMRSFIVGEVPAGGREDVPLSVSWQPGEPYFFTMYFSNGGSDGRGFDVGKLSDGLVAWDDYVSPEDFAKRTQCPTLSAS